MGSEIRKNPTDERKPDMDENPAGIMLKLQNVKRRDQRMGKVPLRIDAKTIIMVLPENCNHEYARKVRKKFNQ